MPNVLQKRSFMVVRLAMQMEAYYKRKKGSDFMFFQKKKEKVTKGYDRTKKVPVIRSSICTGEKVAGFKDIATGKFEDLVCIRSDKDLQQFLDSYGINEEEIKWEY